MNFCYMSRLDFEIILDAKKSILEKIFVDYELGGFGNRKVAFVLKAN